jgi:hypothetical protein
MIAALRWHKAALWRQPAAQNLARRRGAVQRAQGPALDLPALAGADELPAIGRNAMHVEAARRAMIGNIEQGTGAVRHEDLQIGDRERRVAGDPGPKESPGLDHSGVVEARDPPKASSLRLRPGAEGDRCSQLVWAAHYAHVHIEGPLGSCRGATSSPAASPQRFCSERCRRTSEKAMREWARDQLTEGGAPTICWRSQIIFFILPP